MVRGSRRGGPHPPRSGPSPRPLVEGLRTGPRWRTPPGPGSAARRSHRVAEGEQAGHSMGVGHAQEARDGRSWRTTWSASPRPVPRPGPPAGCSTRTGRSRRRRPWCSARGPGRPWPAGPGRPGGPAPRAPRRGARRSHRAYGGRRGEVVRAATAVASRSRSVTAATGSAPRTPRPGTRTSPGGSRRAGPGGGQPPAPRQPARPDGCRRSTQTGPCRAGDGRWASSTGSSVNSRTAPVVRKASIRSTAGRLLVFTNSGMLTARLAAVAFSMRMAGLSLPSRRCG